MPDNEITPVSRQWLSVQTAEALPVEKINVQLLMLQTAYPTSTKNYSREEFQALQSLWYNIFKNVPEDVLSEAVRRFIINDRKGFFPSPGQIVGYIEQIAAEQEERRLMEQSGRDTKRMLERYRRIDAGENCANCRYYNGEQRRCEKNDTRRYRDDREATKWTCGYFEKNQEGEEN